MEKKPYVEADVKLLYLQSEDAIRTSTNDNDDDDEEEEFEF